MIYAVNKYTKEHRPDRVLKSDDEFWIDADEDGWIPWHGGECPLPDDTECEYRTKDGSGGKAPAGGLYWDLSMEGGNIIAYRPVFESKGEDVTTEADESDFPAPGSVVRIVFSGVNAFAEDIGVGVELPVGHKVRISGRANFGHGDVVVFECTDPGSGEWCYGFHKPHAFNFADSEVAKAVDELTYLFMEPGSAGELAMRVVLAGYRK